MSAVVVGYTGDVSPERKRENILQYQDETSITDDNGDTVTGHSDYSQDFYTGIIELLTAPGDWILIPHLTTGKDHGKHQHTHSLILVFY